VASQGLRLLAFIVAARILGQESFGELGMLQSTVGMVGVFAGLGVGLTATKHLAQFRHSDPARAGRIIGLSLLVAVGAGLTFCVLLRLLAPVICSTVLMAPGLTSVLRLASVVILLNTLLGAQTGALAGLEAFRSIAAANLAQGILVFPLLVAGVWAAGLAGAVGGLVVAAAAGWAINQFLLSGECRKAGIIVGYRPSRSEWALLARFSLPALLSGSMSVPVQWLAATILVQQPGGYVEMGAFSAANQWKSLIVFLPGVLEKSTLPILTDLNARSDFRSYRKTLRTHLLLSASMAIAIAMPVGLAAPFVMSLYGEEFSSNWGVLPLLAAAGVLASANTAVGTVMISRGAMWLALSFNCLWAICLVSSARLLIPAYGAIGLALSFLIAYAAHSVWQFGYWFRVDRSLPRRRREQPPAQALSKGVTVPGATAG
jgi:O-antigen/teichoic acid export membrane protein